jgi:VanZ family protein
MPPRLILKYWLPVLLWMAFIFWMSTGVFSAIKTYHFIAPILRSIDPTISENSIKLVNNSIRKVAHVTEYFISGLLVYRALRAGATAPRKLRLALSSFVFILLLAASDEFHQSFVASRTASVLDVGIDTAGGLVAIFVSMLRQDRKGK